MSLFPIRLAMVYHRDITRGTNVKFQWYRNYGNYVNLIDEKLTEIKIPVDMQRNIKKVKQKLRKESEFSQSRNFQQGDRKIPLISCKNTKLNFLLNQTYSKFSEVPLASKGWLKGKAVGDYFTINSFKSNPVIIPDEDEYSFERYKLDGKIVNALQKLGIVKPTRIQNACIPKALKNENILCCGQTGSGKTLAYILPIMQKLLHFAEKHRYDEQLEANAPLSLIITPSRELATQVWEVANEIGTALGLNIKLAVGGQDTKKLLANPEFDFEIDMLISTPGALNKLVSSTMYKLSQVKYLVLDEVDTMLDDSFIGSVKYLFKQLNPSEIQHSNQKIMDTQLLFVGATIPTDSLKALDEIIDIDSLVNVIPDNLLHFVLPHVSQKFLRISINEKPHKVLKFASKASKNNQPTMIFTSTSKTCEWLSKFLEENNVENISLFGYLTNKVRLGRFEGFKAGACPILVCTDIASRGLDTTMASNLSFYLHHMSDYIHRVGRIGRVGSTFSGFSLNFICKPWEVALIKEIEYCFRKNEPLTKVDANIKKKIAERHKDEKIES
ncbi:putative ATP-dependent RNA helicase DDX28 [Nymphon striatum]|nr:putative ATP-dependent RNA helicase DDX28 [Nymphon striatum]